GEFSFRPRGNRSRVSRQRLPRVCGSQNAFLRRLGASCRISEQAQTAASVPDRVGLSGVAEISGSENPFRYCGSASSRRRGSRSAPFTEYLCHGETVSIRV